MTLVSADFNGLFGDILCLSHEDSCRSHDGSPLQLAAGQEVTAFEDDSFEGNTEYLVASGVVEPAPPELSCSGSRWVLRIDEQGVRHLPRLPAGT